MKKWTIKTSKKVLKNKFFTVRKDFCLTASGKLIKEYYIKEGRGSAVVFALTPDDEVIVEKQYRHGIKKISLDLPSGTIRKGETPKQAAKRELLEETGGKASKLTKIGQLSYSPANSEEQLHIFLATGVTLNRQKADPKSTEEIELYLIPRKKIIKYIKQKKISCVLCVAAILIALKKL